jgi:protein TonB
VTRPLFMRWFGWSVAAHIALGFTFWIVLPRVTPPSLPASDAAVLVVSLIAAPSDEHATDPTPPQRHSRPAASAAESIDRSTPASAPIIDDSVAEQFPEPSLPELVSVQPEATAAQQDGTISSPPAPALPIQKFDVQPSAGASTDHYRPLVLAILERAKRYPLLAQRRGIEGTVEIAFMIDSDGRLSDPELIASSTHHMLDEATLALVRRVGSVPPPPDTTPVRFPASIQYRLDQ